jgi:hypothetical protein
MSDNLRRYFAIESRLKQLLPAEPQGNFARRLRTLALCVSGLVGARKAHLPAIAGKTPGASSPMGGGRESRVRRLERWLRNKAVTPIRRSRPRLSSPPTPRRCSPACRRGRWRW